MSVASIVVDEMMVSEKESDPETDEDLENRRSTSPDNLADIASPYSVVPGKRETPYTMTEISDGLSYFPRTMAMCL